MHAASTKPSTSLLNQMCSCRCLRFDCSALLLPEAWLTLQDQFRKGFTLLFGLKPSNSCALRREEPPVEFAWSAMDAV